MRVLQVYNRYRSGGGGETIVVHSTMDLLARRGHEVRLLERDSLAVRTTTDKLVTAVTGVYSFAAEREMTASLRAWRPDIVHVHNLYPLLTPSILGSCEKLGVPVVMTVHNYGLTCPIQTHVRRGVTCTECVEHGDYRCAVYNCRNNMIESLAYAGRHGFEKMLGLFRQQITLFLPVSEFVDGTLRGARIPATQTRVIPNGVAIPTSRADPERGTFALFVGRYTEEKGVMTLLAAAAAAPEIPVRFYGDGPLLKKMKATAPGNVSIFGWQTREEIERLYFEARCVVVPSIWNDPCPMAAIEGLSYGLPVVASRVGGLPSLVTDGETGFLVAAGSASELAKQLGRLQCEPGLAGRLGKQARAVAESSFSETAYYERLMEAYEEAIQLRAVSPADAASAS